MNDQLLDQPVAADPIAKATGPTPWEVLWQRKSYVALGAIIGLVLGVLYWSMSKRLYETRAQLWVWKKQPDAPISGDPQSLSVASLSASEDFLSTHRTLIQSAVIVGDAVAKGRLAERAVFHNNPHPADSLARVLTVSRDRDKTSGPSNSTNQILNISFRCNYAEDCQPVLQAVIDSYCEYLKKSTQDSSKETLELIQNAQNLLKNDLEKKEEEHDKFLKDTPLLWKSQYGTTLYQERLATLDAQHTSSKAQVARLRGTLEAVNNARKQGRSQADLLELLSGSTGSSPMMGPRMMMRGAPMDSSSSTSAPNLTMSSLEQELISLQLEESKLSEDLASEHPRIKSLRERIHTVRAMLAPAATPQAESAELRERENKAKEHLVALRLSQLKQELADAERGLRSLNGVFDNEMKEARKAFPIEAQEAAFRRAIERSQDLYEIASRRLRELNVVSTSRGFETQLITSPRDPEKVSPKGSLIFPISLFMGLLLGSGLAYLAEFTDKSFRSPEDIRRRLGLPIMGIIPLVKDLKTAAAPTEEGQPAPSLFVWHRKASKESEAYRGVRTALYFSTHGQGRKVIQVTSPNKGDGKSTLAANLAVSIAQSGKSVLLIDADLRRPQVGKLFDLHPPVGFASVLGGLTEPNDAIIQTVIPGLSVIPAGPTPPNPAELLTGTRLHEVMELFRDRYDYVIVDSPPLLAVTDPCAVGPQVDGVVLALRPTKKSRIEAKRAAEILQNLGVTIFGVVVNALDQARHQEEYGYYGYYRYYDYHEDSPAKRNGEDRHARVEPIGGGRNRS